MIPRAAQRCGNCDHWFRVQGHEGLCTARAPTAILVGMAQQKSPVIQKNPNSSISPIVQAFYPPTVESAPRCGDWIERMGDWGTQLHHSGTGTTTTTTQDEGNAPGKGVN